MQHAARNYPSMRRRVLYLIGNRYLSRKLYVARIT